MSTINKQKIKVFQVIQRKNSNSEFWFKTFHSVNYDKWAPSKEIEFSRGGNWLPMRSTFQFLKKPWISNKALFFFAFWLRRLISLPVFFFFFWRKLFFEKEIFSCVWEKTPVESCQFQNHLVIFGCKDFFVWNSLFFPCEYSGKHFRMSVKYFFFRNIV